MKRPIRYLSVLLAALAGGGSALASVYRTYDGVGNNLTGSQTASWGAAGTLLLRKERADYRGDTAFASAIDPRERPAPRTISNALFAQSTSIANSRGMTSGVWQFGQFLDHDIDFTPTNATEPTVMLSPGDPYGMEMIPFTRSDFEFDVYGDRQQINQITSYIDASNVYGSSEARASALREMSGGRLKSSGGGYLLPTNDMPGLGDLENANEGSETILFVAGDVRANEQLGLISMHTLFMREHNRLVGELVALPDGGDPWTDERLYQTARRIVGAEIQAITYNEFLPALMGSSAPRTSDFQYDPGVNAAVTNEFSTAFYRVGHTMLNDDLVLAGDGGEIAGEIKLADAFFRPSVIRNDSALVEKILMGLTTQQSQEIDTKLVDGVRNFLFAPTGQIGMDLASLNIQRGRDHGLPDYNTLRLAYGLPAVQAFEEITALGSVQQVLAQVYGDVDHIDAWVGALAEDHAEGTSLGPLLMAALDDQFTRLRDGDRFFYTGDTFLMSEEIRGLVDLSSLTLMDLMDWNTSMKGMPASFFMIPEPTGLALCTIAIGFTLFFPRRSQ